MPISPPLPSNRAPYGSRRTVTSAAFQACAGGILWPEGSRKENAMFLAAVLCLLLPVSGPHGGNLETAAAAMLDDWHAAAAAADEARYFAHFATDAVFLGTDATE